MTLEVYRCIRCHKRQDEASGKECGNPVWHMPREKQAGACWRCHCDDPDIECGCCHMAPCELRR